MPDGGETLLRYWQRTRLVRLDAKVSDCDAAALLLRFVDREHPLCNELKKIVKRDIDAPSMNDLLSDVDLAQCRLADASKAAKDDLRASSSMTFLLDNIRPLQTSSNNLKKSSQTVAPPSTMPPSRQTATPLLTKTQTTSALGVSRGATSQTPPNNDATASHAVLPRNASASSKVSEPARSLATVKRYSRRSTAKKRNYDNIDDDDDDYNDDDDDYNVEAVDDDQPSLKKSKTSVVKSRSAATSKKNNDNDNNNNDDDDNDVDDKRPPLQAELLSIVADAATSKTRRCEFCSKQHGIINVRSPKGRVLCLGTIRLPRAGRAPAFGKAVVSNGPVTHVNLYPVGYVAEVEYGGLWYRCSVGASADDEDQPRFRVECISDKLTSDASTPSAAWTDIMRAQSRTAGISGPKYFLVNDPTVARAIYALPNAKTLWDRLGGPAEGPAGTETESE